MLLVILCILSLHICDSKPSNKSLEVSLKDRLVFLEWKQKFNKTYESLSDENEAMQRIVMKSKEIDDHNILYDNGKVSYRKGLWKYSDMTKQEKDFSLLGLLLPLDVRSDYSDVLSEENIRDYFDQGEETDYTESSTDQSPQSVDWVKSGLVGPVEEQGLCGSCWAFSSKGVIEALLRRQNITTPLSPQQMVDCSDWSCYGCQGGWPPAALEYMIDHGFTSEKQYPYLGDDDACYYNQTMRIGSIDQVRFTWTDGNETMLKEILAQHGPISIMMHIEESFYDYESGVYYEPLCGNRVDHAMLMVGYGSDEKGGDYWLIKNSWGENWGDRGYVKFARNRNNMCNIAHSATVIHAQLP